MKGTLFTLTFLLALGGCNGMKEKALTGKWQACSVLEDGMPLDVNPDEVKFRFFENGLYTFNSTLSYKEAGTYKIIGDLLYTLDTINEASSEKTVKVMVLTEDSLFIKMNADGKEQLIKLYKANN